MLLSLIPLLLNLAFAGEIVKMNKAESDEAFVQRITKEFVVENQLFRNKDLVAAGEALIAFTEDAQENINLHVFIKKDQITYEQLPAVLVCDPAGGAASIASVFYFDVDKDKKKEITALCKWHCRSTWDCCLPLEAHFYKVSDKVTAYEDAKLNDLLYRRVKSKPECKESRFTNATELKKLFP